MGEQAPSDHTIFNWFREFQRDNFSVQDGPRSGRPSTSVNEQTIDAVRKIIEDDPHSTISFFIIPSRFITDSILDPGQDEYKDFINVLAGFCSGLVQD
ncbi:unnamed protein product [Rotaria sp. Silwood2]|nr:unnamed protein product [Rotaria sp. Silwood2]